MPSQQALASVGGSEITRREVMQELASSKARAPDESGREAIARQLEYMIDRRIMAQRAEELGLESDPRFHFAMRRAREELLAEALQRKLARGAAWPSSSEVATYIASQPWRFARRFYLELEDRDQRIVVDSHALLQKPEEIQAMAGAGSRLRWQGRDWAVRSRVEAPITGDEAQRLARRELIDRSVLRSLQEFGATKRSDGSVIYQVGWGPGRR